MLWMETKLQSVFLLEDFIYESDGYSINVPLPWKNPNVPAGTYYVYCWIDFIDNGIIDTDEAIPPYSDIFGSVIGYYFTTFPSVIIDHPNSSALYPTYTVDGVYAPQIDFILRDSQLIG